MNDNKNWRVRCLARQKRRIRLDRALCEVANELLVTEGTVSRWENGKRRPHARDEREWDAVLEKWSKASK